MTSESTLAALLAVIGATPHASTDAEEEKGEQERPQEPDVIVIDD